MQNPSTHPAIKKYLRKTLFSWTKTYQQHHYYKSPDYYKLKKLISQIIKKKAKPQEVLPFLDTDEVITLDETLRFLKKFPDIAPFEKLVSLLSDDNNIASMAIAVIGSSKNTKAPKILTKTLNHKNYRVRKRAMIKLAEHREPRAYNFLIDKLK